MSWSLAKPASIPLQRASNNQRWRSRQRDARLSSATGPFPGGLMSTYAVVDPATGQEIKRYPAATDADIEQALASAAQAYATWSRDTTVAERAALVRKVGELHT